MKKLLVILILLSMAVITLFTVMNTQGFTEDKRVISECIAEEEKVDNKHDIGIVKNIYEVDGIRYVEMDMVEFYRGEEAIKEAMKDGKALYDDHLKSYYLLDGYYIRNNDDEVTTYKLSQDVKYYLSAHNIERDSLENASLSVNVSSKQFDEYIINSSEYDVMPLNRSKLFWIDITNEYVTSLVKQYTP